MSTPTVPELFCPCCGKPLLVEIQSYAPYPLPDLTIVRCTNSPCKIYRHTLTEAVVRSEAQLHRYGVTNCDYAVDTGARY